MSERDDMQWLDEPIRQGIDAPRPEFDAEAWKRKYAKEYDVLLSRGRKGGQGDARQRSLLRWFLAHPGVRLAAAAAIIIGATVLLVNPTGNQEPQPQAQPRTLRPSPARIVSMMSLRMAYKNGGEEGLNRQLDTALKTLGPRPGGLSTLQILSDLDS